MRFDLDAYRQRIDAPSLPNAPLDRLQLLHRAHVFHVPFENLDIHLRRAISLQPEALYDKIVRRGRGGYCFEQNGLFALVLQNEGFTVERHLARVIYGRASPGPRTHQVSLVEVDGRKWLADGGFGGPGLHSPIPLEAEREDVQDGMRFKLREDREFGYVLQRLFDDCWIDLYAFDLATVQQIDFEMSNFFTSNYPQSPFRARRWIMLMQRWGSVSLENFNLTTETDGETNTEQVQGGRAYMDVLATRFGLHLDAQYDDFMPLPAA
ncbi:MAG: arylamine N-acetyltransferase [Betaproteobacteria bacterium]